MAPNMAALHPDVTDKSRPLTARLKRREVRVSLQEWMRDLGIKERGPANFPVVAEALTRGIEVSATKRGAILLALDGERFAWRSGWTSLNHESTNKLAVHKEVQSRIFRSAGLPFPENTVFAGTDARRAWDWARHVLPVVVKPPTGSKGRDVFVDLTDEHDFLTAFTRVADGWGDVLVEEFRRGSEHRLHVVDGRFTAALVMLPANVTGDGVSTVEELVAKKNRSALIPHRAIRLEEHELAALARLGLHPGSVIEEGRTVFLRRNSNLSTGGDSVDATDDITREEARIVEQAAKAWPGMRVVGFDMLLPRKEGDGEPSIIEANVSAGIGGHHRPRSGKARELCVPILNAMFPQTARPYPTPPRLR